MSKTQSPSSKNGETSVSLRSETSKKPRELGRPDHTTDPSHGYRHRNGIITLANGNGDIAGSALECAKSIKTTGVINANSERGVALNLGIL